MPLRHHLCAAVLAAVAVGCGGGEGFESEPSAETADSTAPDAADDASEPFDDAVGSAQDTSEGIGITPEEDAAPPLDPDLSLIPKNPTAFSVGIMAGDAEPRRAMIWTRYGGTRQLRARITELSSGVPVSVVREEIVSTTTEGYVHLDVDKLTPATEYQYAFLEHDGVKYVGRSEAGRFKTAFDDETLAPIVFGGTSCNHLSGAPFASLAYAAGAELDFFIHTGDHIYGDAAHTLAEYRAIYDKYWAVKHLAAVHRSTGLYTIWDDHEVVNNWAADTVSKARVDAARRAFFEYRAFRKNTEDPKRLWRSFKWGKTAEIFILDVRSERLRNTRLTSTGAMNPDAQYISRAQMDWVKAGLKSSTAVFKFVVTSKYFTGPNNVNNTDAWEGYGAQRTELLGHILNNDLRGVWFLTGDVHKGIIDKVQPSGAGAKLREIYMGPGGSGGAPNPSVNYCNGTGQREVFLDVRSTSLLRADPIGRTLEIEFIGDDGKVLCKKKYPAG